MSRSSRASLPAHTHAHTPRAQLCKAALVFGAFLELTGANSPVLLTLAMGAEGTAGYERIAHALRAHANPSEQPNARNPKLR